jgi:hypothetical protein
LGINLVSKNKLKVCKKITEKGLDKLREHA